MSSIDFKLHTNVGQPSLFILSFNLRYVDMVVFRIILKVPLKRVQNGGKIYVMFNRTKVHLVPHFGIILLYSCKLLALNICLAKFHARTRNVSF